MSRRGTTGEKTSGESAKTPAREPYIRPTLKALGSVRELTLGALSGGGDGKSSMRPM
jgi:hypothetical protein